MHALDLNVYCKNIKFIYYKILQIILKHFVARENEILKVMVMTKPELYLDEYKYWFQEITGKQISISTICRSIIRLGFTYKKVKILGLTICSLPGQPRPVLKLATSPTCTFIVLLQVELGLVFGVQVIGQGQDFSNIWLIKGLDQP